MSSSAVLSSEHNSARKQYYQQENSHSSATIGSMHPHPTIPDKLVTANGQIITRPKSKQQAKKQRQ